MSAAPSPQTEPATAHAAGPGALLPQLPIYTAQRLGRERAALAEALRERLLSAGLGWPAWSDARPGRLELVVGDLGAEPLLSRSAAALIERHGELLLDGLGAAALATGAQRLVLAVPEGPLLAPTRALCRGRSVELLVTPPAYPSRPGLLLGDASERAWIVPASRLVAFGAVVQGRQDRQDRQGRAAPHLCTIAGAVRAPQVVDLAALSPSERTPVALVRRCGGAADGAAAWVAIRDGAPSGVLWPAESELPIGCQELLVLPASHELVRRLRRGEPAFLERARNACLSCRLCTDLCPEAQAGVELAPHRILRGLALGKSPSLFTDEAARCTGCGTCSALCPAELLPASQLRQLQTGTPLTPLEDRDPERGVGLPPPRQVGRALLLARLGLADYDTV